MEEVEQLMNEGKLSVEELRKKLKKQEFKFLFEELIEKIEKVIYITT